MTVADVRDVAHLWREAIPYDDFVREASELKGLWDGVYRVARVPDWAVAQARRDAAGGRLLILNEDWCWDAANTLPVLAKLRDASGGLEMRVLSRDEYPEVMDRYLTNGTRSIPIVIALDPVFRELGAWGPRPQAIQAWAVSNRGRLAKDDFYAQLMRRYGRDRGESTLREVLALFNVAGTNEAAAAPIPTSRPAQ